MPHITIAHSSNLESTTSVRKLVDDLHRTVADSGLFEIPTIRTRALPHNVYRIADGNPENVFVHVIARIKAGRSVAERKKLGNTLLETARAALKNDARPLALGVEIHEIDPEMLFRHITIKEPAAVS